MANLVQSSEELPLTEATLLILLSLAPGPNHGYGILKDVESLSHGRIIFSTGTLYGALKRLLEQRWIERFGEEEVEETGRPRKQYVLTAGGRRILGAELARMEDLVHSARRYLADNPG